MGNKIARPRDLVDEGLSCPHASVLHKDVDHRKLRQLILNGELAPCDPGAEEYSPELDECPICFLFYPNLNRSSCCSKYICTECYLQIKAAGYTPHANCPFCKTSNYKVEYCGAKTPEEKYFEQAEEQKAIEAKIRIRQKELRDEQERRLKHGEDIPAEARYLAARRGQGLHSDVYDTQHLDQFQESFELEESQIFGQDDIHEEQGHQEFVSHLHGEEGAHLDMENVMFMKAIWLSIKDQSQESVVQPQTLHGNVMHGGGLSKKRRSLGLQDSVGSRGQVASGSESFLDQANSTYGRIPDCQDSNSRSSIIKIPGRCSGVHGSMVENETMDLGRSYSQNFPSQMREGLHEVMDCLPSGTGYMIPESYDEQIMLAVALSLADEDARGR